MAVIEPVTPAQSTPVIVTLLAEIDMANDRGVSRHLGCSLATGVMIVIAT